MFHANTLFDRIVEAFKKQIEPLISNFSKSCDLARSIMTCPVAMNIHLFFLILKHQVPALLEHGMGSAVEFFFGTSRKQFMQMLEEFLAQLTTFQVTHDIIVQIFQQVNILMYYL
jgi:hypothetical protein